MTTRTAALFGKDVKHKVPHWPAQSRPMERSVSPRRADEQKCALLNNPEKWKRVNESE